MLDRFVAIMTKDFWVSAPRWVLIACISGLVFLCGILTQQVRDLRSKNDVMYEEREKARLKILEDNTKEDVATLKTIVANHSYMMDKYWAAMDRNSEALLALTKQVSRLANETRKNRNDEP